uniref:Major facilitator superfamily domain-containing protein 12 n=1 Tax=Cacopsylla melanoneura TaxID=428564 RepID=A0A8D8QH04_9HEMI
MDQDEEDDDEEPAEESIDFESMVIDVVDRLEESSMSDDGEEENEPLLLEEGGYQQRGVGVGKRYSQLRSRDKLAYGLGHVFNDICAALWFSYSLIFLQNVVGLGSFLAGILLFLGQAVDAVSTPISGKIIDESGNRKKWYLTGEKKKQEKMVSDRFHLGYHLISSHLHEPLIYSLRSTGLLLQFDYSVSNGMGFDSNIPLVHHSRPVRIASTSRGADSVEVHCLSICQYSRLCDSLAVSTRKQ